ncbi:hypothetical protein [Streptomyces flaveus]|uniref:hypothetical protein n=1 Tax=Streptomyces flaveus TaxID=66370 RepID=UPI0033212F48
MQVVPARPFSATAAFGSAAIGGTAAVGPALPMLVDTEDPPRRVSFGADPVQVGCTSTPCGPGRGTAGPTYPH